MVAVQHGLVAHDATAVDGVGVVQQRSHFQQLHDLGLEVSSHTLANGILTLIILDSRFRNKESGGCNGIKTTGYLRCFEAGVS